jgi:hypothetical protein
MPTVAVPYMSSRTPLGVGIPRSMCVAGTAPSLAVVRARAKLQAPKLGSLYHRRPRQPPDPAIAAGMEQYEQDLASADERVEAYLKPDAGSSDSSFDIDRWLMQGRPRPLPAWTHGAEQAPASPRQLEQRQQNDRTDEVCHQIPPYPFGTCHPDGVPQWCREP